MYRLGCLDWSIVTLDIDCSEINREKYYSCKKIDSSVVCKNFVTTERPSLHLLQSNQYPA